MEHASIGSLFGSVEYQSPEDIKNIIEGLTIEQSLYFLSLSLEISNRNGMYSLVESEILSKSIRIISTTISNVK